MHWVPPSPSPPHPTPSSRGHQATRIGRGSSLMASLLPRPLRHAAISGYDVASPSAASSPGGSLRLNPALTALMSTLHH